MLKSTFVQVKDIIATQAALMNLLTASHKAMSEKAGQFTSKGPHT
jgi:hypothetical protein